MRFKEATKRGEIEKQVKEDIEKLDRGGVYVDEAMKDALWTLRVYLRHHNCFSISSMTASDPFSCFTFLMR